MIDPPENIESTSTRRRIPSSASRARTPMWKKEARKPPPDSARPILTSAAWGSAVGTTAVLLGIHDPTQPSGCQWPGAAAGSRRWVGSQRSRVLLLQRDRPVEQGARVRVAVADGDLESVQRR